MRKPEAGRLDLPALMRSATAYLARQSASTQHLREVLARKLRRHDVRHGLEPSDRSEDQRLIDAVMARVTAAGWLDDSGLASSRARRLVEKGLPRWRIERELAEDGLEPGEAAADVLRGVDEAAQARRYAQRKRIGPYRRGERAPFRIKDIGALARAGFRLEVARAVVDSRDDFEESTGDNTDDPGNR